MKGGQYSRPVEEPHLLIARERHGVIRETSGCHEDSQADTLRPLDTDSIVQSVAKTNRMVTLEEGWPVCGIGSEIAAVIMEQAFDDLDAPVVRVAGADVPMPYAANLEKLALPTVAQVVEAAKSVCYR